MGYQRLMENIFYAPNMPLIKNKTLYLINCMTNRYLLINQLPDKPKRNELK
jgi:hypothetical protein